MDAFSSFPPPWTAAAKHGVDFTCPSCGRSSRAAKDVWINRRSPLYRDNRRVWQEFYLCECGTAWWGWNDERPPSPLVIELREE
ncbi:MAG: hypothetical protein RMK91_05200 [Pseudanabaenaceae cyanobacterium SKYGB_i_bin29]|nr:hypothetical protein [Pseudanabaenaceae cyanobacterium SKYG29]MDW8421244.1 hypothetical protein [Pseudanabaenaceae cyanobacterium SKYGB_i_bin29]